MKIHTMYGWRFLVVFALMIGTIAAAQAQPDKRTRIPLVPITPQRLTGDLHQAPDISQLPQAGNTCWWQ